MGAGDIPPDSIPVEWGPEKNIAWKSELPGYGQSSPVIWNDRVFLTCVEGDMKDQFHVVCLALVDGRPLWKKTIDSAIKVKSSTYVSRAAPTPVVDSDRVIAMFENGDLVAWTHDGEQIWQRSLVSDYGAIDNQHCIAASPLQTSDHIFVLVDHKGPSYLLKINKLDGKTDWKADREGRMSWASPVMITVNQKPYVLISSQGSVDGYDPETGELVWRNESVGGNSSVTPLSFGDGLFLVGASIGEAASDKPVSNLAMQIVSDNGKLDAKEVWNADGASCTFGSPVVYDGYAYWVSKANVLFCFNAKSGVLEYKERIGSSVWATPLGLGNRVYFFGKNGETTVVASGPKFAKIATNRLWSEKTTTSSTESTSEHKAASNAVPRIVYGVAAVPGSLLIRTGNMVYCVRED
jgi:outer membrane protein assembly factor BamB